MNSVLLIGVPALLCKFVCLLMAHKHIPALPSRHLKTDWWQCPSRELSLSTEMRNVLCRGKDATWMIGQLSREFWISWSSNSSSEKSKEFHTPHWQLRRVASVCPFSRWRRTRRAKMSRNTPQVSAHTWRRLGSLQKGSTLQLTQGYQRREVQFGEREFRRQTVLFEGSQQKITPYFSVWKNIDNCNFCCSYLLRGCNLLFWLKKKSTKAKGIRKCHKEKWCFLR